MTLVASVLEVLVHASELRGACPGDDKLRQCDRQTSSLRVNFRLLNNSEAQYVGTEGGGKGGDTKEGSKRGAEG